jgi:DNA-binding Xre family transcriptional regulator
MSRRRGRIGSSFEDFLREDGRYDQATSVAVKRVLAWQLEKIMAEHRLSKSAMANRMGTSRAALDRLLDPANGSVTLATLQRAAAAVGRRLHIELV